MRLLGDTHTFLWWVSDDKRLPVRTRRAIAAAGSECWLSHASVWEMAIKASLGKGVLDRPVERFVGEQCEINGFRLLPITLKHISAIETLAWHHRLVSQALAEGLVLATRDSAMTRYGVSIVGVNEGDRPLRGRGDLAQEAERADSSNSYGGEIFVMALDLKTLDIHSPHLYASEGFPWAAWNLLLREAPVFWYERDDIEPFWAVTRYADLMMDQFTRGF